MVNFYSKDRKTIVLNLCRYKISRQESKAKHVEYAGSVLIIQKLILKCQVVKVYFIKPKVILCTFLIKA
jgi:hypothetical protein